MRIYVKEKDHLPINICIPTILLANKLVAHIAVKGINAALKDNPGGVEWGRLETWQIERLLGEIIKTKRKYPDLYLVNVECADGEVIKIKL